MMGEPRPYRLWRTIADWWSFQMGTLEWWLFPRPESPEEEAIRLEGERIRKAFPHIDFDRPKGSRLKYRPNERP